MSIFPGPGPVFEYEWLTGSRRWQVYASRAFFVSALLIALCTIWWTYPNSSRLASQVQNWFARPAYFAIVGTQLVLVLLAAPAATAGAVCVDRARGTLSHVLVTDLTDAEIVLGKLAARLTPVLMLIGCTLPVVLLCTLLGGIDPDALLGAYAVTFGVAVLGCSLALSLSIRARNTHEVLLTTYLIWSVWLLSRPLIRQCNWMFQGLYVDPWWVAQTDPFELAFAAYNRPTPTSNAGPIASFLGGCLFLSVVLVFSAVRRVRRAATTEINGKKRLFRAALPLLTAFERAWAALAGLIPAPALDGNPVLWRDWHRNRPSVWTRRIWGVYIGGAVFCSGVAAIEGLQGSMPRMSPWVNGFQVAVGLLLLSVGAATSLAEERARGSLDILLATPLSTRDIVWGKWLGTFRTVPKLLVLPGLLTVSLASGTGHWMDVAVLFGLVFAYGAFITSLGLALATWVPRIGRAVALCVTCHVLLTVGLFCLILLLARSGADEDILVLSPFGGAAIATAKAAQIGPHQLSDYGFPSQWDILTIVGYSSAAALLLFATLQTFDRCLGRVSESP